MKTVTNDEYQAWRDNDVTKRFMSELQSNLEDSTNRLIFGTHEQMIESAHERNAEIAVLQNVIDWKPSELEENEE